MGSPGPLRQALKKLPLFSIFARCRLLTNNFRSNVCFSCGLKARPRGPVERDRASAARLNQYGIWQSAATKRTRLPCICMSTSTCSAVALIAGLPRVACLELPPTAPVSCCLSSLCDLHTGVLGSRRSLQRRAPARDLQQTMRDHVWARLHENFSHPCPCARVSCARWPVQPQRNQRSTQERRGLQLGSLR